MGDEHSSITGLGKRSRRSGTNSHNANATNDWHSLEAQSPIGNRLGNYTSPCMGTQPTGKSMAFARCRVTLLFPQHVCSFLQCFEPCKDFVEGQRLGGKHFSHLLVVLPKNRLQGFVWHDSKSSGYGTVIVSPIRGEVDFLDADYFCKKIKRKLLVFESCCGTHHSNVGSMARHARL